MLALLIYSIVSTSSAIRKKAQPSVDAFFDGLLNLLFATVLLPDPIGLAATKASCEINPLLRIPHLVQSTTCPPR